ncbi:uncharacterized protein LOC110906812 [Helianthus annuus]|uniref:uncharacterized protein LOC110906812 n=1 Tax=Helianthus annuus TaxID=4232 RepID=UPI000B905642|nr:uncharacterized protein LOC110906812 [Helianthus annuus]
MANYQEIMPMSQRGVVGCGVQRGLYQGEGCGQGQDRGTSGPGQNQNEGQKSRKKDRSKILCFRCNKYGYFASGCLKQKQKQEASYLNETKEDDLALFTHEMVFLNEENLIPKRYENESNCNVWYLDNRESNHINENKSFFSELNERITGRVRFADGLCAGISGDGSILLEGKTSEQHLTTDIYFIPDLRSNIISLGQVTEHGYDIHMKGEYLTMRDRTGTLLMKVPRMKKRLYKIILKIGNPACLYAKLEDDAWL